MPIKRRGGTKPGSSPVIHNSIERAKPRAPKGVLARKGDAQTVRVTETTPATQNIAHHAGYYSTPRLFGRGRFALVGVAIGGQH